MDKLFAVFGKLAIILLVVAAVAGGAYFYGVRKTGPVPSPTPTGASVGTETLAPLASPKATKTVEGGVPKSAGLSFDLYTIKVPVEWVVTKDTSAPAYEKLTISKGAYQLTIMQGATGGAMCLYPGDADFEGPSSRYTKFVELKTQDLRVMRRSGTDEAPFQGKIGFTLCQTNVEGVFGQPTQYGHVSYSVPPTVDNEILLEMDAMVASLKKK